MKISLFIFSVSVFIVLVFGISIGVVNALPELPRVKYITQKVYVDREVERIITQEILIEKEVEVIIEKATLRDLIEFESLEALETWANTTYWSLKLKEKDRMWDCDDYAAAFQEWAINQGYWMSITPVYLGDVWGVNVFPKNLQFPYHMGNMTMIGNDIYYIEPQTGKVTWLINRDVPTVG